MKAFSIATFLVASIFITLPFSSGSARGDLVQYTFTGVLPTDAATHPFIEDGESFTATFIVDRSVPDSDANPQIGYYDASVLYGSLEFSGGFVAPSNFAGNRTVILDDWQGADSVSIRGNGLIVQANNEDLTTLVSDAYPDPGFGFDSAPDPSTLDYFALVYGDDLGTVLYVGSEANNISFQASAIPEPGSAWVLATLLFSLGRRCRD